MTESGHDPDRSYALHGLRVHTHVDEPQLGERLHAFLVHLGLDPCREPWPAADVELRLEAGEPSPVQAGEAWQPIPEVGIRVLWEANRVTVRDDNAAFTIELAAGRATGVVHSARDGSPLLHMNLASYALLTLLRGHDYFPLHAAGLARRGAGVVIVADSGGGKSTLAADLLLSGWQLLSDDSLLLHPVGGSVEALALRRDLFLRPGLGPLSDSPDPEPWPDPAKVRIDARRRFANQVTDRCRPRLLIFPEIIDQAASRLEPCTPAQALRLLTHHSLVAELEPSRAPQHMALLAGLVHQCAARRLCAGRDLLAEQGLAARMLATLCDNLAPRGGAPAP